MISFRFTLFFKLLIFRGIYSLIDYKVFAYQLHEHYVIVQNTPYRTIFGIFSFFTNFFLGGVFT